MTVLSVREALVALLEAKRAVDISGAASARIPADVWQDARDALAERRPFPRDRFRNYTDYQIERIRIGWNAANETPK